MANMSNPYWRSVTVKRLRIAGSGFKPHGWFCKTGKLTKFVQTNNTAIWNQQYWHAIGWPIMAAKLQLRHQPSTFHHTVKGRDTLVYAILIDMKRVDGRGWVRMFCLKRFASWPNRTQSSSHKSRNAPWIYKTTNKAKHNYTTTACINTKTWQQCSQWEQYIWDRHTSRLIHLLIVGDSDSVPQHVGNKTSSGSTGWPSGVDRQKSRWGGQSFRPFSVCPGFGQYTCKVLNSHKPT